MASLTEAAWNVGHLGGGAKCLTWIDAPPPVPLVLSPVGVCLDDMS